MSVTLRRATHLLLMTAATGALASTASAEELTIATVNNADMIVMQKLSPEWEKATGNKLNWVVLEENVLRQRVTTDIATKSGQFDILTIGGYEEPIWGKSGWLASVDDLGDDYDYADLLDPIKKGLTVDGKLYAVPFYTESSFTLYRKDLFDAAGLTMPDQPTYDQIKQFAAKLTDTSKEQYGICLRGKAGWGENMALLTATANSFGARWFDEKWHPQFDQPEWKHALKFYVDLMKEAGPPGASSNGFNENLALFQTGKCGIWIDATVAASFVTNPKESKVADKVGYALFPTGGVENHGNWLWAWNLGVPAGTKKAEAAQKFISWATDKAYTELVASKEGWANVPPGTRTSLYANAEYQKAAPFAKITLDAMTAANTSKPTIKPVPYTGGQFVAIPEFQGIGTAVGQQFSAALAGSMSVDQALQGAQALTTREMTKGGYIK